MQLVKSIQNLFKYSISISFDKKRRQLQDLMFAYAGLPTVSCTLDAVCPEHLFGDTKHTLLQKMLEAYGTTTEKQCQTWSDFACKKAKKCCTMSHLAAIYYAKLNNWPFVLVLEDDCMPLKNTCQLLEAAIKDIDQLAKDGSCKFIQLGYNQSYSTENINYLLSKFNGFCGAFAQLWLDRSYDEVLSNTLQHFKLADKILESSNINKADCFVLKETAFIAGQLAGWYKSKRISGENKDNQTLYIVGRKYSDVPFKDNMINFNDVVMQRYDCSHIRHI